MKLPDTVILYQRRDFSTVLNDSFYFLSQNFFPLSKLILFYAGPIILIESLFLALFQKEFMNPVDLYALATYLAFYILFFMLSSAIILSITGNYLLQYKENGNQPVSDMHSIIRKSGRDVIRFLFAEIGIMFLILFSSLFFLIPAVYVAIPVSLIWMTMIQEGRGFFPALSRSFSLINGYWWRTLALLIISTLIQGAIGFILQVPTQVISFMYSFHQAKGEVVKIPEYLVIGGFFLSGLGQFFMVITALIVAFQYYSIVEKKESPDLLGRIDAIKTAGDGIA